MAADPRESSAAGSKDGMESLMDDRPKCWDCGKAEVAREGYICDECADHGARTANGSLDADREHERDYLYDPIESDG